MPEAALPAPPDLGILAQRAHRDEHEIVEVVDPLLGEVKLIELVDPGEGGTVALTAGLNAGTTAASPLALA